MGKREKEEAKIDYEAMFDHDCPFERVDVDAPDPLPGDAFNAFQQTSAIPLITLPDTILPIMEQEEDEFEVEEDEYEVESEVESEVENKVANKKEVVILQKTFIHCLFTTYNCKHALSISNHSLNYSSVINVLTSKDKDYNTVVAFLEDMKKLDCWTPQVEPSELNNIQNGFASTV
jgi:hypothetical protein